ncbi:hypothetical protein Trydic_g12741 [Trypoxylus dichotomus]
MANSKVFLVLLLLGTLFVCNTECYNWCFYYGPYHDVIVIRCPTTIFLRSGFGEENKECTESNPCAYDGEAM